MQDYKYEMFIPKKFMIGIDGDNAGFASMKDKDGKWTNLSVFEKHCGYKPHLQRDARKEIDKALKQSVREVDNVPTSGFKVVDIQECIYSSDYFRDMSCAVLEDPRGWQISIESSVLQSLLERNGFNVKDRELVGIELMYCWPNHSMPFSVVIADDNAKKIQEETDKYVSMRESIEALKPSQIEVGKVYSSKTSKLSGHLYMYLGKHDVYSAEAQSRAVAKRNYEHLEQSIGRRDDISGKDKHVLYCIDSARRDNWSLRNNEPGNSPYYVTSSLSKLFDTCKYVDLAEYTMHNDSSKLCTFENIKEDMARSAMFNMIDFSKTYDSQADYQAIEDVFGYLHGYDFPEGALKAFPFEDFCDGIFLWTEHGSCTQPRKSFFNDFSYGARTCTFKDFTITQCDDGNEYCYVVKRPHMRHEYGGYYSSGNETYKKYKCSKNDNDRRAALKQMFDELKPMWKQYVLCNGNEVPPHQNIQLNRRDQYYC